MPKASIIIATHGRPNLLPRAVQSSRVAGSDVEIVVVDDASADETARVCQALPGINYVRVERNQGVAGARNIGLAASHGEYLSFLDDDDARLPDSLNLQIEALEREPQAGLVYGQAIYGDAECQPTPGFYPAKCAQGDLFWDLLTQNFIPNGSAVFRRSCLTRVGLLDNGISGIDDWDLWIRIAEIYPIVATEVPVTIWRRSTPVSEQGSSSAARLVKQSVRQFRDVWMTLPRAVDAPRETKRFAWERFSENMAEHLVWESARALRHRDLFAPLRNLALLPRLHPLTAINIARHRLLRMPRARFSESLPTLDSKY